MIPGISIGFFSRGHGPLSRVFGFLSALLIWSLSACSLPPINVLVPKPQPSVRGLSQVGVASWYGPGFHGQATASGIIYNQFELTAAHQTLPLGSQVVVTNLQNGKSIEVSVNDRGPFVKGRIIDLSYAAATILGMVGQGTTRVRIELMHSDPLKIGSFPTHLDYTLQVGSFIDIENALELKGYLVKSLPWASPVSVVLFRVQDSIYFRVQLGTYSDRGEAEKHGHRLAREGFPTIIMEN